MQGRLNRNLGGRGGECGAGLTVTWGVGEENAGPAVTWEVGEENAGPALPHGYYPEPCLPPNHPT